MLAGPHRLDGRGLMGIEPRNALSGKGCGQHLRQRPGKIGKAGFAGRDLAMMHDMRRKTLRFFERLQVLFDPAIAAVGGLLAHFDEIMCYYE